MGVCLVVSGVFEQSNFVVGTVHIVCNNDLCSLGRITMRELVLRLSASPRSRVSPLDCVRAVCLQLVVGGACSSDKGRCPGVLAPYQ